MLTVSHLSYSYDSREILHNLSFQVERGAFCAILGANGSGKTTLLRCLARLLEPQEGEVSLDGRSLQDYSTRELAQHLAFVQQHPQTDIEFSAFETVLMGRNPYQRRLQNESQEDLDIVERCMRLTGTWHLRNASPSQMSGGELQRVMIARAFAQQTPVLFLDEPTSNLDIAHQFEIMELLRSAGEREGKTILIVVHDLNLALHYCPSALLLHQSRLLFQGAMAEALQPDRIRQAFGVDATLRDGYLHFSQKQD